MKCLLEEYGYSPVGTFDGNAKIRRLSSLPSGQLCGEDRRRPTVNSFEYMWSLVDGKGGYGNDIDKRILSSISRRTHCPCLKLRCAGGREFEPRPGQYSRMSFSSDQVTCTVFPHLNMHFLPNSEFI